LKNSRIDCYRKVPVLEKENLLIHNSLIAAANYFLLCHVLLSDTGTGSVAEPVDQLISSSSDLPNRLRLHAKRTGSGSLVTSLEKAIL